MSETQPPLPRFINPQTNSVGIPRAGGGKLYLAPFDQWPPGLSDESAKNTYYVEGYFYRDQLTPYGPLVPFPKSPATPRPRIPLATDQHIFARPPAPPPVSVLPPEGEPATPQPPVRPAVNFDPSLLAIIDQIIAASERQDLLDEDRMLMAAYATAKNAGETPPDLGELALYTEALDRLAAGKDPLQLSEEERREADLALKLRKEAASVPTSVSVPTDTTPPAPPAKPPAPKPPLTGVTAKKPNPNKK